LLAHEYAATLMRVTFMGFQGVTSGTGFRRSRKVCKNFGNGADDGSVSMEGDLLDSNCDGCWKKMFPNTQSIDGL